MRKKLFHTALVAAGLLAASAAPAKDLTGWFVNGGAGHADYHANADGYGNGDDNGTAALVNAGYRWQFIGVEAGYTDIGSVKYDDIYGDSLKLSGDGWTIGLNGHFNPTRQWYISSRVGAFVWKVRAKASIAYTDGSTEHYSDDRQSMDWYAGVGTGWDIDRHWNIGVNFDYYDIDKDGVEIGNKLYTVNAEYRF